MRPRGASAMLPLAIVLAGCASVPGPTVVPGTPAASAPLASTSTVAASRSRSPAPASPSAGAALDAPKKAAQHLLATRSYDLELKILREKRSTDPVETLVTGSGRMEPPT